MIPPVTAATAAAADIIGVHLAGPLGCCWPAGCGALSWADRVLPGVADLAAEVVRAPVWQEDAPYVAGGGQEVCW